MKHIKYIVCLTIGFQLLAACSDDFVDVETKGTLLEDYYYSTAEEANHGVVAAYDPLGWTNGYIMKVPALNAASDDFFAGGGGPNDIYAFQVWDKYTLDPVNGPQQEFWNKNYSGIFRANILMTKLPGIEMDEALKARYMAELKFLRAYYYFDMARLFYAFPQPIEPIELTKVTNEEQKDREAAYEIIEADLKAAIVDLPEEVNLASEAGRATKAAANALLGKVYLQQEKFDLAAEQFAKVTGSIPGQPGPYGHDLLENFADLWKLDSEFNKESIFEISHNSTSQGVWDNLGGTEGNPMSILIAPRGYSIIDAEKAPSFVSGWSFNTVTPSLVNAFVQGGVYDPRYAATISNIDSLEQLGIVSYEHAYENTGYFLKKYSGFVENKTEDGTVPMELNFPTNTYDMRLADIYLLEAECIVRGGLTNASKAQTLLDAVRARVGLSSVPATFDNIMAERRLELAGEGHRWFDLVRTGLAPAVLGPRGYIEGKHDALPIPQSELEFDGTPLVQDPAY